MGKIQQLIDAGISVIPEQSNEANGSYSFVHLTPEQHAIFLDIVNPPSIDELRRREYNKAFTIDEFLEALIEDLVEKRPGKLNAIQKKRMAIKDRIK